MPKVSVLVPTYRPNAAYLREALDSLLAQTEGDFHCVICDEPTDTDTETMLGPYLRDPRFAYNRNDRCLGIGGNWNRCATYAEAPVMAYLFQDDLWAPEYLARGLEIFEKNPSAGFVSMGHDYRYESDLKTRSGYEALLKFRAEEVAEGLHRGGDLLAFWIARELHPNFVGEPPFVMIRRALYEEVGPFNESLPQFLDVEYWLRCLQVSDWYNCREHLGTFRVHADAASARNDASGAGMYDRLLCFENLIAALDGSLRRSVVAARNRALEKMIDKFLNRIRDGKGVHGKGGRDLRMFCLRHPILVGTSLAKASAKRFGW